MNDSMVDPSAVVEINVGGVIYATSLGTLTVDPDSLLGRAFRGGPGGLPPTADCPPFGRDSKGRCFIDRDGVLFRFVLDFLRNRKLVLPECFHERERLRQEAEFYQISGLARSPGLVRRSHEEEDEKEEDKDRPGGGRRTTLCQTLSSGGAAAMIKAEETGGVNGAASRRDPGYILVGYRGTFAFGRDGCQADVKFRKMWRILVCGRVALCREVFKDTLNESRDVDRGTTDRYTSRFFLKHTFLEQAFDMLQEAGFRMTASCGSGTNSAGEMKPGMDSEENKWNHYNEFVFSRP